MPWKECRFRDQNVYVRVMQDGKPIVRRGSVEIRYKLGSNKSYRPAKDNIEEIEGAEILGDEVMGGSASASQGKVDAHLRETPKQAPGPDTIIAYTDGACSGNPGPAGIGIYIERPESITRRARFVADGTNNMAELSAILGALEDLSEDERTRPVHLYTDSAWSLGVLIGGWKAKTNLKLIEKIKAEMETYTQLELLKVRGHAGIPGNEEADYLATRAIRREENSDEVKPRSRSVED